LVGPVFLSSAVWTRAARSFAQAVKHDIATEDAAGEGSRRSTSMARSVRSRGMDEPSGATAASLPATGNLGVKPSFQAGSCGKL
jgi:hypothetical protein